MFDTIDRLGDEYSDSINKTERKSKFIELKEYLRDQVRLGVITPVQEKARFEKAQVDWVKQDIRNAIVEDSALAKQAIIDGEFGDLSASESRDWIEVADKVIAKNQKHAEIELKNTWRKNLGELNKDIKGADIIDYINGISSNTLNPDTARKMINYKLSPESEEFGINETKKQVVLAMMDKSQDSATDLVKFQEAISNAVANSTLDPVKAAELQLVIEPLFEQAIQDKGQPNAFSKAWSSSLDFIKQTINSIGGDVDKLYDVSTQFMTRVLGENVKPEGFAELARGLVKEQVRSDRPSTVGLEDVPNGIGNQADGINTVFEGTTNLKATQKLKGQESIKEFDSIAEAEAASLPVGTKITVKGRLAVIE